MTRLWQRFGCDRRGATAIIFGIVLIPVIVLAGLAVDYARALSTRSHLSHAIDAAALAGGSMGDLSAKEIEERIQAFFDANRAGEKLGTLESLDVKVTDTAIDITVTSKVDTTFLALAGIDQIDVGASTRVLIGNQKLELALVLDNTGSMNSSGKIQALRVAAKKLVNTLYAGKDSNPNLRIALVPFVTAVNVKASSFDWAWIDTAGKAKYHGINFDESKGPVNHFDLFAKIPNAAWKGCVEARAEPYDVDDTPPSAAAPDTLWVPWFWPDEPDKSSYQYHNNYLLDKVSGPEAKRQASTKKYDGTPGAIDETPSDTRGPNKSCARPIIPLVDDKKLLISEINAMDGWNESGTNIAQGMMWGWRVLSPEPPFTEGVPSTDEKTNKVMIVLTDGENMIWGGWHNHNKSDYNSYGYLAVDRLGTQNRDTAIGVVNDKTRMVCDAVKSKGIGIYTITFKVSDKATKDLMRDCASKPSMYFDSPSNKDLEDIFQIIANSLIELRLAK